jgi:hypothetical protein
MIQVEQHSQHTGDPGPGGDSCWVGASRAQQDERQMESHTDKGHRPKRGQKGRGCRSLNVAGEIEADSFHARQTGGEAECEYSKS